jgi:hypothetical protein
VLDCLGSEEYLNMLALENNPIYLSRSVGIFTAYYTGSDYCLAWLDLTLFDSTANSDISCFLFSCWLF